MNAQTIARIRTYNPQKADKMEITLNWLAAHFNGSVFDRFTKDGKGGRVCWMRKPASYPKAGLPWHDVRGRYAYPEGK